MEVKNKRILIFGGAGSLGSMLVKLFLNDSNTIISVSRDEAKQWKLRNKFPCFEKQLITGICDIRDLQQIKNILHKHEPEIIIAAAAMKQVDTCEFFPEESVKTNILGIENIIQATQDHVTKKNHFPLNRMTFCFVSTDKAVCPINIYGMCKSISEKLVVKASKDDKLTKYLVVRYGNVLNSKGSIVPLLKKQSSNSFTKELTLTSDTMTRFMMTLEESAILIKKSLECGQSGEIWVPKLDSMRLLDLFEYFSAKYNKPFKIVGVRPGEKIHEMLVNEEESMFVEEKHGYMVINRNNEPKRANSSYISGDFVIEKEVLQKRLEEFFEKGTYVR
jgi:UDP-glucose 4-epimerase